MTAVRGTAANARAPENKWSAGEQALFFKAAIARVRGIRPDGPRALRTVGASAARAEATPGRDATEMLPCPEARLRGGQPGKPPQWRGDRGKAENTVATRHTCPVFHVFVVNFTAFGSARRSCGAAHGDLRIFAITVVSGRAYERMST
jgi:hypothetical protein